MLSLEFVPDHHVACLYLIPSLPPRPSTRYKTMFVTATWLLLVCEPPPPPSVSGPVARPPDPPPRSDGVASFIVGSPAKWVYFVVGCILFFGMAVVFYKESMEGVRRLPPTAQQDAKRALVRRACGALCAAHLIPGTAVPQPGP